MIDTIDKNVTDKNNIDTNEETTSSVVSEIIKKNNLKDFDEESVEKLGKNESFVIPGAIINDCAKKIALSTISDKEAQSILENYLGVQEKMAEELVKDIKIKIVPIIQKSLKVQKNNNLSINNISKKDELPLMPTKENIEKDIKIPVSAKSKIKKISDAEEDLKPNLRRNKGPDTYREPIE